MRVLVVEDDLELAELLCRSLEAVGLVAEGIADGEKAAFVGATEDFDAAVLDLGMPQLDGISILRHWREQGCRLPVLVLTARSRWSDKVDGFAAGADDYLTKPFELDEVPLRIRALLRRSHGHASATLRAGPLELNTLSGLFALDGRPLGLTAQEQRILAYLMHRAGELVSRMDIGEHVYARDLERDSNTIDVLISRIRRKIGHALIQTERGQGFRLVAPAD